MVANATKTVTMARYRQYRRNRYNETRRRYRCMDCSAQFWDLRDDAKMWRHSEPGRHSAYGHGGFQSVPERKSIQK